MDFDYDDSKGCTCGFSGVGCMVIVFIVAVLVLAYLGTVGV